MQKWLKVVYEVATFNYKGDMYAVGKALETKANELIIAVAAESKTQRKRSNTLVLM